VGDLAWTWLAAPYVACALAMVAIVLVGGLIRGDRVMRLGSIGAGATALPWAVCSTVAACTNDPALATRLYRLGNGPIAFVGPALLLVLLGVTGQLERYRWVARIAGLISIVLLVICWATPWTIPTVHRVPAGIYYISAGPMTGVHFGQLVIWLVVGLVIARRSTPTRERRVMMRILIAVLALGAVGITDMLLVYDVAGVYPIAWGPILIASALALYLVARTDLLRSQGLDRGVVIELIAFALTVAAVAAITLAIGEVSPLAEAAIASAIWVTAMAIAWGIARQRPTRARDVRALDGFVAQLADVDDVPRIGELVATLWQRTIGIRFRALWAADGDELVSGAERWKLDPEVVTGLVVPAEPLAVIDLATMRLGALRDKIEALGTVHGAQLIVPLLDRGSLVGLVEADHDLALREDERGLVADSARAAARALTYAALARSAARERETAREVEVAEAMRLQTAASRDDELGRWAVAAEYRSAPRTTGACWSAALLADGRLAVLVAEAQTHGVPAALATAALTGAFAAATHGPSSPTTNELVTGLRASAEGAVRGGEPIAAFLAILDATARTIEWVCAGHPGAHLMPHVAFDLAVSGATKRPQPVALGGGGERLGASVEIATRGLTTLAPGTMLIVASAGMRHDDAAWEDTLRTLAAAGSRLPALAVETVAKRGEPSEDLLAIVVRHRAARPSEPVLG
jgi:hypothetical protein